MENINTHTKIFWFITNTYRNTIQEDQDMDSNDDCKSDMKRSMDMVKQFEVVRNVCTRRSSEGSNINPWYPVTEPKPTDNRLLAFALHFDTPKRCNTTDNDTIRLLAVEKNTNITHFLGVAELLVCGAGNMPASFEHGVTSILRDVRKHQPTIIVLDYNWLEKDYYKNRYGLNWVDKVSECFNTLSELRHCILPCDRFGELKQMFKIKTSKSFDMPISAHTKLYCHLLTESEAINCHPLVVATRLVKDKLQEQRVYESQRAKYLAKDFPFLLITRDDTKDEAIKHLQNLSKTTGSNSVSYNQGEADTRQGTHDNILDEVSPYTH